MTRKDAKVQVIGSVSDGATQEDQNNQSYVSSALLDSMLPRGDDGSGGNVSRQTNRSLVFLVWDIIRFFFEHCSKSLQI